MPCLMLGLMLRQLLAVLIILLLSFSSTSVLAASKVELDAGINETLQRRYKNSSAAKELGDKAKGILVFPKVIKGGMLVGGEYGQGGLLVEGRIISYYSTVTASIGLQLGVQARSQVIMFMDENALNNFRGSDGWEAGVDGSVAIAEFGAAGTLSSNTVKELVIGFILDSRGLMYNLTFEGTKFSRIEK